MKVLTEKEKIFRRQLTNTVNRYLHSYTYSFFFTVIDEVEDGVYLIGTKNPLSRYKVWVDKEKMLILKNDKVLPDIMDEHTNSFFSTYFFYREMDGAKIYD